MSTSIAAKANLVTYLLFICLIANLTFAEENKVFPDWTNVKKSPFPLEQKNINNPVLTIDDIDDRDTYFIADCSLFFDNNNWYMLFEVASLGNGIDIGLAISKKGFEWEYQKIILDEPFTLAYR